jgi:hypothetical protein
VNSFCANDLIYKAKKIFTQIQLFKRSSCHEYISR